MAIEGMPSIARLLRAQTPVIKKNTAGSRFRLPAVTNKRKGRGEDLPTKEISAPFSGLNTGGAPC